jgi:GAF domain-containing protein
MTNTLHRLEVPRRNTEAALQLAAEEAARITGADGAAIAIGNSSAMCCCASAGDAPDVGVLVGPDSGLSGVCLRTSELVQCDDTASDPRIDPQAGMSFRSVLIVPVTVDGRLQAILEVVSSKPHAFNAHHHHELSRMAQGIATLLTDTNAKRPPKSETREHRGSSTITPPAVKRVEGAGHRAEARTVSDSSEGPQQQSTVVARDVSQPVGSHSLDLSAVLPSLSAATKAGIGVALAVVLALGWYIGAGLHKTAGNASAPATKADTTPLPTAEQRTAPGAAPEITVEQNSLSVVGLEGELTLQASTATKLAFRAHEPRSYGPPVKR